MDSRSLSRYLAAALSMHKNFHFYSFFDVSFPNLTLSSTIVHGGSVIWQKKLGDFGTKICYFIRKNMAENGPLVFRTVLYSNYDEKLGNHERKTLR